MENVAELKQGMVLGKDFRILRPLAAGGMGAVYIVEQISTGRERALKIMHPQYVKSEDSRARFTQEARVGAKIRSDHVVEVVSAGVDDDTGIPWLAMELLDGEELAKRIQRKGLLAPQETLEIFRQLCHALGEAHKNGLVHRDLKPQNLFMARSRRQGEAFTLKILDFGVAKLVQEQQGEDDGTKPVGTPRWMAPEQSESGAAIRPATDVWALGLIAFNCLTGKYYWRSANAERANLTALLKELCVESIVPASQRAAELNVTGALPRGFDEWFARCVVREQERRFVDANAALEALIPVLDKAPGYKPASAGAYAALDDATTPQGFAARTGEQNTPNDDAATNQFAHNPPARSATPASGNTREFAHPLPPLAAAQQLPAGATPNTSTRPFAQPQQVGAQTGTQQLPPPSKAPAILGVGLGVAALAVALFVALKTQRAPEPVPQPVAAQPAALPPSFTVVFDSFPGGAEVFEGEKKVGQTPMQLSLQNAGLDTAPRKFRLVREGFLPYEVMQGQSREPVRVLATLAQDPNAPARAAEEARKEAEKKAAEEKKNTPAPKKSHDEEPEIRTRR